MFQDTVRMKLEQTAPRPYHLHRLQLFFATLVSKTNNEVRQFGFLFRFRLCSRNMDLCLRIDVKPKCFFLLSFPGSCRLLHPSIHPIRLSHSLLLRCCRFFSRGSCCPPVVFHLFLFCFVLFFFCVSPTHLRRQQ